MVSTVPGQLIYLYWIGNGGSPDAGVTAVAVAMAESGGDPAAISPSQDYGLWQINIQNFTKYGLTVGLAENPDINAAVAVKMSNAGMNWGPWCTAWVQPVGNCGHYLGPTVQAGSPASKWLPWAAAILGKSPGLTVSPNDPGGHAEGTAGKLAMANSWAAAQHWSATWAPQLGNTLNGYIQRVRKVT